MQVNAFTSRHGGLHDGPDFDRILRAKTKPHVQQRGREGDSQLLEAARKGDDDALVALLARADISPSELSQALFAAPFAPNGGLMLYRLVESGRVDLAARNSAGQTLYALVDGMDASKNPDAPDMARYLQGKLSEKLGAAVHANDTQAVHTWLAAGADGQAAFGLGVTFLHRAASLGNQEVVAALLDAMPQDKREEAINAADEVKGNTVLHAAARSGNQDLFDWLVEKGADVQAVNSNQDTPADLQSSRLQTRADPYPFWQPSLDRELQWGDNLFDNVRFGDTPPPPQPALPPTPALLARGDIRRMVEQMERNLGFRLFFQWNVQGTGPNERLEVRLGNLVIDARPSARSFDEQLLMARESVEDLLEATRHFTGQTTLRRIFSQAHDVRIIRSATGDDTYAQGNEQVVAVTGRGGVDVYAPAGAWNTPQNSPAHLNLHHQLVRAADRLENLDTGRLMFVNRQAVSQDDARALGLGPFWNQPGTDATYRNEINAPPRAFINTLAELNADGTWGFARSAEEEAQAIVERIGARLYHGDSIAPRLVAQWEEHRGELSVRFGPFDIEGSNQGYRPSRAEQTTYLINRLRDLETIAATGAGHAMLRGFLFMNHPVWVEPRPQAGIIVHEIHTERENYSRIAFSDSLAIARPVVIFFHELLHAYHLAQDERGLLDATDTMIDANGYMISLEEARTTGLGPFAFDALTQNVFADQLGAPRMTYYESPNELIDGYWAGIDARSPQEWWAIYNARQGPVHMPRSEDALSASVDEGYRQVTSAQDYHGLLSGEEGLATFYSSDDEFGSIIRFHQEKDGEMVNMGVIDKVQEPELYRLAQQERDALNAIGTSPADGLVDMVVKPGWAAHLAVPAERELLRRLQDVPQEEPLPTDLRSVGYRIEKGQWSHEETARLREILGSAHPDLAESFALYDAARSTPSKQQYEDALNAIAVAVHDTAGSGRSFQLEPVQGALAGHYGTIAAYLYDTQFAGKSGKDRRFAPQIIYNKIPGLVRDRVLNAYGRSRAGYSVANAMGDALKDNSALYGRA